MFHTVVELVKANPLLSTGILATSGGMFWTQLKAIPSKVSNRLWESFSSTVEIRESHYEFYEIRLWINSLTPIFTPRRYQLPRLYTPVVGPGTYWYRKHDKLFSISIVEEKDEKGNIKGVKLIIRIMGRNIDANHYLLQQVSKWIRDRSELNKMLKIGVQSGGGCDLFYREKRDPTTLFHRVYPVLKVDIERFLASKPWYDTRGIPYHRGYLLFGPPGTGKTSIIKTIAGVLNLELYIVNRISNITQFLNNRSVGSKIIVIEDIDRDFKENKGEIVATEAGVDVSGFKVSDFLNAVDGIVSNTGCIFIFTANDIHYLPQAMMRPGRIDKAFEVGFLNKDEIQSYINLFVEGNPAELEAKLLPLADKITGASVQLEIMKYLNESSNEA